ncbi:MAG: lytic transglycosylase domain-containing protein [Candidatus Aegiribacteria sp.]|nr:lytic transglycosylase domain-containing protein [Candidatus Aegiribacteria sp.]
MKILLLVASLICVCSVSGYPLETIDSLVLTGRNNLAVSELLELLRESDIDSDQLLFRLTGIYHATGRFDECILLLDSIERARSIDLSGWKISLLDLSCRQEEALLIVSENDILLRFWLTRDSDERPVSGTLPAPENIAERAIRSMICQEGRMNKGQIDQTVDDSRILPFLVEEVCDELEITLETAGSWWDEVAFDLAALHENDRFELLQAKRERFLFSGTVELWEERLDCGGEISAIAAMMLIGLDKEKWSQSWRITDALVEEGYISTAESLAAISNDPVFFAGMTMSILRETSRFTDLLAFCDSIADDSPDSLHARAALFRARALRALKRPASEYYSSYHEFAEGYPWHPTASEAAYLTAKYYDSERNWPAAASAYMESLSAGNYGGALAYWRGGFCHYMCGRGNIGDSIWVEGIRAYPFSAWCDEMLFWRARYANRTGNTTLENALLLETAQEHSWEFYGLLASERTGGSIDKIEYPLLDLSDNPVTSLAVEMMKDGYGAMASSMLYTTEACDIGLRAAALSLMGEHHECLALLRRYDRELRSTGVGMLPDTLLCFYYPAPYRQLTESTVSSMNIDPFIVTGLMRQESYFNRLARSWIGAKGLIQLMPGTAGDIARWYGLPVLSGNDFYIPENSILYGSLYLARQNSAFNGSSVLALAAYNAGPGNAAKWMEAFPLDSSDPELFIEQIPFTETRGYVKHVLANAWLYSEILN